jgi:hypothetical protein
MKKSEEDGQDEETPTLAATIAIAKQINHKRARKKQNAVKKRRKLDACMHACVI